MADALSVLLLRLLIVQRQPLHYGRLQGCCQHAAQRMPQGLQPASLQQQQHVLQEQHLHS
jgi:hypothetical protein